MPHEFQRLEGLYLADVEGKGRGLFCRASIEKDAIIETAPVLLFNEKQALDIDKTDLYHYYFTASFLEGKLPELFGIADPNNAGILAIGLMSFCNHSENPNAKIDKTIEGQEIIFTLRALGDIPAGAEITISYGGPLWFEPVKD